jgi:hypothetical protein
MLGVIAVPFATRYCIGRSYRSMLARAAGRELLALLGEVIPYLGTATAIIDVVEV